MCGRIATGGQAPETVREPFDKRALEEYMAWMGQYPRYNVAPTETIPVVQVGQGGSLKPAMMRWGLVPRWAKPGQFPGNTFNARAESVAEKPTFRDAFRRRRCLIPVAGFYEWK